MRLHAAARSLALSSVVKCLRQKKLFDVLKNSSEAEVWIYLSAWKALALRQIHSRYLILGSVFTMVAIQSWSGEQFIRVCEK
jgi:hypothetical protein